MRLLCVAVILALVVYVSAEGCGNNQDCVNHGITQCGGGTHVVCHNHHCECLGTGSSGTCSALTDCPDCDGGRHKHCVDGQCRCTSF